MLRDVVSWVLMLMFNVFHFSLQLANLKVMGCLSHAAAQPGSLADVFTSF